MNHPPSKHQSPAGCHKSMIWKYSTTSLLLFAFRTKSGLAGAEIRSSGRHTPFKKAQGGRDATSCSFKGTWEKASAVVTAGEWGRGGCAQREVAVSSLCALGRRGRQVLSIESSSIFVGLKLCVLARHPCASGAGASAAQGNECAGASILMLLEFDTRRSPSPGRLHNKSLD